MGYQGSTSNTSMYAPPAPAKSVVRGFETKHDETTTQKSSRAPSAINYSRSSEGAQRVSSAAGRVTSGWPSVKPTWRTRISPVPYDPPRSRSGTDSPGTASQLTKPDITRGTEVSRARSSLDKELFIASGQYNMREI